MDIERNGDVALLRIRGTKANSMTPEMVAELRAIVGKVLESDARALVVTGEGNFFSAGLALPALVGLGRPELRAFMKSFARTMRVLFASPKHLAAVALEGRLFTPVEALAVGLVDAVVAPSELEAVALARARTLGAIPPAAFATTKESVRRPVLEAIDRYEESDADRWLDTWFSADAQERLRATVAKLGG